MGRKGVDIKFARARGLVDELAQEVERFLAAGPYRLEQQEESSGDLVIRVRVLAEPPVEWSVIIGDAVHNARSALDYLAYALVEQNAGTADERTYFPIGDKRVGYGDKLRSGLRGASKESRDAVRALQPWRGGDDQLWRLHRLDIIDKHRLLVPVGAAHRGVALGMTFAGFGDGGPIEMPTVEIFPKDRQYPLQDGAEVFRIMKAARDVPDSGFETNPAGTFEVAFGDGVIVQGEPLVPVLREMVEHAAAAVEPLASML
jgi:hypothetical protein